MIDLFKLYFYNTTNCIQFCRLFYVFCKMINDFQSILSVLFIEKLLILQQFYLKDKTY